MFSDSFKGTSTDVNVNKIYNNLKGSIDLASTGENQIWWIVLGPVPIECSLVALVTCALNLCFACTAVSIAYVPTA